MRVPKVSCICITHQRKDYLRIAIDCFLHQTYPNKELSIWCTIDDLTTPEVVAKYNSPLIALNFFPKTQVLNLGQKRNYAIENTHCDFVCTWDDDDWYHCRRIELQVDSIQTSYKPVSLLSMILIYDSILKKSFVSGTRLWEQTIMFEKQLFSNEFRYDELSRSEDKDFVQKLLFRNLVYPLFQPKLYIYNFHGRNTWDKEHFYFLIKRSQSLSTDASLIIKHVMDEKFNVKEGSNALDSSTVLSQIRYVS